MALIKCTECTHIVSSHANSCPQCGYPVASWPLWWYLHRAASDGNEYLVRKIIANGTDIDIRDPQGGDTALIMAAFWGRESMVKTPLSLGANINAQNENGSTPIFWAISQNHRSVVSILIDNHADLSLKTDGRSLLHCAALGGELSVLDCGPMDLLIAAGADVNLRDSLGETPLHHAIRHIYDVRARYLLAHGADVNAKNNQGKTPLAAARAYGSKKMVRLLQQHGAVE